MNVVTREFWKSNVHLAIKKAYHIILTKLDSSCQDRMIVGHGSETMHTTIRFNSNYKYVNYIHYCDFIVSTAKDFTMERIVADKHFSKV